MTRLRSPKKSRLTLSLLVGCASLSFYALLVRRGLLMSPAQIPAVLCIPSCQAEQPVHAKGLLSTDSAVVDDNTLLNTSESLNDLLGNDINKEKVSVLIEKSKYQLTIFYNGEPIKAYSTVFGSAPEGDKLAEGDRKTPEGIYHVRDLYEHPDWSKFIWLDYPTPQDWREHAQAKAAGEISPTATIGSEVGIHGVPQGSDGLIDQTVNWTWGCISLKNKDVDEIYSVLTQGTLIEIIP